MPTDRLPLARPIRGALSPEQAQELFLGPAQFGSFFRDREHLKTTWFRHRDFMLENWGNRGRRPAAFYEFEWEGEPPEYDVERSTLWRAGAFTEAEQAEVEREWFREFEAAYTRGLDAAGRRQHFQWADIPREFTRQWTAERRGRGRTIRELQKEQPSGMQEAVVTEG